jgi:hypothetical protein
MAACAVLVQAGRPTALDTIATHGAASASTLVRSIRQSGRCTDLQGLARELGLTLEPMRAPGPPLPARRIGDSLFFQEHAPADWLRAFFTREIAVEALAQCGVAPTNKAIEHVCATIRRYECRRAVLAEAEAVLTKTALTRHARQEPKPKAKLRPSEARLRLELS